MSTHADPVTPALLRENRLPAPDGHKSSRGHVAVVGGSRSTPGAVLLAGVAALRVGAGVLAIAAPEPVAVPIAVAVPEAAVIGFAEDASVDGLDEVRDIVRGADGVLIGPGLDGPQLSRVLVSSLLGDVSGSVVLDAFALGVLPQLRQDGISLPSKLVLTPNSAEAARLLECEPDDLDSDPQVVARSLAERWQATVSYASAIADASGACFVTGTGHPGVGTSGSGDVLAGCVVGLLARGVEPLWAAIWATYLHGAAGDRLAAQVGQLGFLARELVAQVPLVLAELQA
jgi:ADP-dependent NAD(P)H-hydrate dehydratase